METLQCSYFSLLSVSQGEHQITTLLISEQQIIGKSDTNNKKRTKNRQKRLKGTNARISLNQEQDVSAYAYACVLYHVEQSSGQSWGILTA